ncbi:MAG: membrane protein insertase YidC [Butyrivibrio sp.]|nr:membrane protein insertase YidC [Muribaculum sp.]MCM1551515.1 membrane protein insertase YidC [Butyrivibrio sp.]
MDTIVNFLGSILGYVMAFCYGLIPNYGVAIIFFTFLTKIILLPISILVHLNSIKMVKMQPYLNLVKANHYGDQDAISEEQLKLYKQYNYHPMLGLIPLFIQIVLLMGVINVIYNPLRHILRLPAQGLAEAVNCFSDLSGISTEVSSIQILLADAIGKGEYIGELTSLLGAEAIGSIQGFDMGFLGINLAEIPSQTGGSLLLIPLLAAFCAWLLCVVQNKINVLQSEQGKFNKLSTMLLSVGLSLYLGFFVPAGVGLYWMAGNLFAILQLVFLNFIINPHKFIDYELLESSRAALDKAAARRPKEQKKLFARDPYRARERQDYKTFYQLHNKQLVFYSEKNGFYKYYQNIIEYIMEHSDLTIDYITNDPEDAVFELASERFRVYYIGDKRIIPFMMKMDANVVVMTTPDLEKYQIKRSLLRKDIEYIFIPHDINSPNLALRTGALDHFDTYFAPGPREEQEIRALEQLYGTKTKNIVRWGSGLLDNMIKGYNSMAKVESETRTILIAPSWQEDNLLDLCIEELLDELVKTNYNIIVRPHPQYLRYCMSRFLALEEEYSEYSNVTFQKDFSSTDTVYKADLLITDWSSIGFEYSFATLKPTLSVNTPMKVINPEWQRIDVVPFDIAIRTTIGKSIDVEELQHVNEVVEELLCNPHAYSDQIRAAREAEIFYIGNAGEIGAKYILEAVKRVEDNKEDYMRYM